MTDILPINPIGPTLTKLFLVLKNYLAKRDKESEKVLVQVLNIIRGLRYIKILSVIQAKSNFFTVGSLTMFHYEDFDIAMHSVFRMHSSYD